MSGSDDQCKKPAEGLIELEPAVSRAGEVSEASRATAPEGEPPIPQRPLHICPHCDYNLTGLTSRRCPECGEPFTILDARARGFELSEDGRQFRRGLRTDRAILVLGVLLLVFGLVCPCMYRDPVGTLHFAPTLKTWGMWLVLLPLIGLLFLINLYYEQNWSRMLLETGILVTIVGLLVAFL
jgi:hypothetical protein